MPPDRPLPEQPSPALAPFSLTQKTIFPYAESNEKANQYGSADNGGEQRNESGQD
jgi:hypothetical protein